MKYLLLFTLILLWPDSGSAQYTVTNKTHAKNQPRFVVENKTKYDPYKMEYSDLYKYVSEGGRGILTVGKTDRHVGTYQTHCLVPSGFKGLADGEYECSLQNGHPTLTPKTDARVVASPTTKSGCGCEASANCGASFCKSRGGTGCPESCPIKKR